MCDSSALSKATEKAQNSTKVYKENFQSEASKYGYQAKLVDNNFITVCEGTSFAIAKEYVGQGKIGVLNFANPHNPGGGVVNGAMAQEECLCRSSNLYPCLLTSEAEEEYYTYNRENTNSFFSDRVIYTDNVTVFKNDDAVPALMPENEWFNVSVLTCAAPYLGERRYTNKKALEELFVSRIKNIFEVALDNHIQVLILGAFGCGAFKNPPEIVAKAFSKVIKQQYTVLQHNMKKIVFAIKSTHQNSQHCPNLIAFKNEIGKFKVKVFEKKNPKISVIGGDLSTFGKNDYYGGKFSELTGVKTISDTYWYMVVERIGTILSNVSYSDKLISDISDDDIKSLENNNIKPDIVIVNLGIEDALAETDLSEFSKKYSDIINKIKLLNSDVEIWCVTIPQVLVPPKFETPSFDPDEYVCVLSAPIERNVKKYNDYIKSLKADKIKVVTIGDSLIYDEDMYGERITKSGMLKIADDICKFVNRSAFGKHIVDDEKNNKYDADYKYAPTDPNRTVILYDNTLKLFVASSGEKLEFKQDVVSVGKETGYDVKLNSNYVSRQHARFYFENSTWYIADTGSTNGVWLNGDKLEPKTKYELTAGDEIDIAHEEMFVFYKINKSAETLSEEQQIEYLQLAIRDWKSTDDKEEKIKFLFVIIKLLLSCPMYIPVSVDTQAMFEGIDVSKLKKGQKLQLNNDVRMKISTVEADGRELVPIFTTKDEVDKGPDTSVLHMYPCDYLPKLAAMNKDIIINAFGDNSFVITAELLNTVIISRLNQSDKSDKTEAFEICEGTVIDRKYELLKQIGQGAFTKTYLAMDKRLNKAWAAKICIKNNSPANVIAAMINEANFVKKLNHPAIPNIIDIIDTDEYLCVVEDYIEGATLEDIYKEYGAQPQENIIDWARQLCDVLGYLHSQKPPLIHRDIKPANIILKPDGRIVLVDFGIMREYKPNNLCDTQNLGTKGYAAPEQYGARQTDARTDIFGLGMTMHHLVTGVDPKTNNGQTLPICQINSNLSKGLEYIVNKCIEIDPDKRFQTMQELRVALDNSGNSVYASPDVFGSKLKRGLKGLFGKRAAKQTDKAPESEKPEMKLVRCENGHFYNANQYSKCPHCKPYPFNKQNDIDDIPCVYASPDIMGGNYSDESYENDGYPVILNCDDEN